jgi:hypothetical protein
VVILKIKRVLLILILAILLASIMCYVSDEGLVYFLASLFFSLVFIFLITEMVASFNCRLLRKLDKIELVKCVGYLRSQRSRGSSLLNCLKDLPFKTSSPRLKEKFVRLYDAVRFGENFENAMSIAGLDEFADVELDSDRSLALTIDKHELELKDKISKMKGSLQGHATINMFIATVLPSFIVFSFVGSAIISGYSNLILISIALMIILPSVYAGSLNIMRGRLLE